MLFFSEEVSKPDLKYNKIKKWLQKVFDLENKTPGEISVIFTSDNYLLEINKEYLQEDYYTDVISFNYNDENLVQGDIFISSERVKENSELYKVNYENELLRVIVHGVLHLIGYEDKEKSAKSIMTKKEDTYLRLYGELL